MQPPTQILQREKQGMELAGGRAKL